MMRDSHVAVELLLFVDRRFFVLLSFLSIPPPTVRCDLAQQLRKS